MKMRKNESSEASAKAEDTKKCRKFFLYAEGKGFIHLSKEVGAMPSFDKGDILWYTSRKSAMYAREFFISIKLADSIDILSKVA